jgi:hypothetical protein
MATACIEGYIQSCCEALGALLVLIRFAAPQLRRLRSEWQHGLIRQPSGTRVLGGDHPEPLHQVADEDSAGHVTLARADRRLGEAVPIVSSTCWSLRCPGKRLAICVCEVSGLGV